MLIQHPYPNSTAKSHCGKSHRNIRAYTLVELLVAVFIIGILIAMLLPAVQYAREAARRAECSSHLRNIGLALANYQSAHRTYPALGRTIQSTTDNNGEVILAWTTSILPYIEATAAAGRLQQRIDSGTLDDPWDVEGFYREIYPGKILACPSDLQTPMNTNNVSGHLSYRACAGDLVVNNNLTGNYRGIYGFESSIRPADISDGLSNTIQVAECAASQRGGSKRTDRIGSILMVVSGQAYSDARPQGCIEAWLNSTYDVHNDEELSGTRWADGRPYYAGVVTALSPNSVKCGANLTDQSWGVFTAGSRHAGGCFVSLGDGGVRFMSSSIDAGSPDVPSLANLSGASPYGVWGSLGTRAGHESVSVPGE